VFESPKRHHHQIFFKFDGGFLGLRSGARRLGGAQPALPLGR
jgi:hypothetical protein